MRFADRNDPEKMHVLIEKHQRVGGLNDLLRIRGQSLAGVAVREAHFRGIVVTRVPRGLLREARLGSRLKRRHLAAIEVGDPWSIRVVWTDDVRKSRTCPHAGEVWFPVSHARD